MNGLMKSSLNELMTKLEVESLLSGYSHVGPGWRDIDYVPDYNKLYFILGGDGELVVDNKKYSPQSGEIFLMPANIKQSYYTTDPRNTYTKYWFHFSAKVGDINLFEFVKTPLCVKVPDIKELSDLFTKLVYYDSHREIFYSKALMNSYAMQIVCYFLSIIPEENIILANSYDIVRLMPVISYIDENLGKEISLDTLAEIACLQQNYFINFFRKYMGTTPIKYVNYARIERAVNLLGHTDMKIVDISANCGYLNEMYFSKAFKKAYGMSPREYRNRITKEAE